MKRIAVLTWHNNGDCNCGQTLQAFALQKKIEMLGCYAVVIDYIYIGKSLYNKHFWGYLYGLYKSIKNHRYLRMIRFNKFVKENMIVSRRMYSYEEISRYLRKKQIKYYLVGSDQVWNAQAGRIPKAMLLEFDGGTMCSYSPSLCPEKDFNKYESELLDIVHAIKKYKYVGVREESAKRMLCRAGSKRDINVVLDPVFLFSDREWMEVMGIKERKRDYVLVYCVGNITEEIKKSVLSKQPQKDVYVIVSDKREIVPTDWKKKRNVDPKQFVELVVDADYIITDSYHMVAFSIIFRKQFSVFTCVRNDFEPNKDRIVELLSKMNLLTRLDNEKDSQTRIEYENNEELIRSRIEESQKFLKDILSSYS